MASLYKRARSPFWWIQHVDATGRTVRRSLKLRWALLAETRQAELQRAKHEVQELDRWRGDARQQWQAWVPGFLKQRYEEQPLTLRRYLIMWHNLSVFLRVRNLSFPTQLQYTDCLEYLSYRRRGDRANGIKAGGHNTVRGELKLLHLIVKEAIRRGFCSANAAASLGIKKHKPAEKPEIPTEHLRLIHDRLQSEPAWMLPCFLIALYTGCRLRETWLPMSCVDVARREIHFANPKGGRPFTVPMHDKLVPLFTRLAEAGATHAYEMPKMISKDWWFFFKRIGHPEYCFHCLRVSFISRGARAGVDERAMRRLVNHAGSTIHRVYQRYSTQDLRAPLAAIPMPELPESPGVPGAT